MYGLLRRVFGYPLVLASVILLPIVTFAGPQEQFLEFTDDYVDIADSDALDLTGGAFTVSAWIKPTAWGNNNQGRIIDHGGGSSGGSGWSLHLENKASNGSPQALRMQINNSSTYNDRSDSGVIQLDTWQHVAVSYDGVTLAFYVNAISAGQSAGAPVPLARSSVIRIGARATDAQRFFTGAIDEVRIWNRALSQQDILALYNLELTGSEPGLVAYYSFNEGSGQVAADASPGGFDGQLGSSPVADDQDPVWKPDPPVANTAPQVDAGLNRALGWSPAATELQGSVSDDGLPAATLSSTWTVVSGPGEVVFADPASPSTSATFSVPGTYVLRLSADDTLLASSDDVTIQLQPVSNTEPQVDAGPDRALIWSPVATELQGSVGDDGLPVATLSSNWTVVSGPGEVVFADPTSPSTSADFAVPGTYVLRLSADDTLLANSDDVIVQFHSQALLTSIEITPNPATVAPESSQQFSVQGFDQTGAPLPTAPAWSATGGTIDAQTGLYTADLAIGQFSVEASDRGVSASVKVYVAPWPTAGWTASTPQEAELDQALLEQARDYALTGGGSGYITRRGRLVMSWGSDTTRYEVKSTTKSVGAMILGLALKDGLLQLDDVAQTHLPSVGVPPDNNSGTGWLDEITILNLATHTAGFEKTGDFGALMFEPGTVWAYTDGGANWLADVLTSLYAQDLHTIAFDRLFTPLGLTSSDLTWRENIYRPDLVGGVKRREFGAGIGAHVDALARIGYLMLRGGRWESANLIPAAFVEQVRTTQQSVTGLPVGNDTYSRFGGASDHYGILWWNNADGAIAGLPVDAYWAWGIGDSLIVVIPSLDMVVTRAGSAWDGSRDPSYYQALEPFLAPIAQAALVGAGNEASVVQAGADQLIKLPVNTVHLTGAVSDHNSAGALTTSWSVVAGPGNVSFGDSSELLTAVQFSLDGTYVLRLTADDGIDSASDDVTITVA